VKEREEYRALLSEQGRKDFARLPISEQRRVVAAEQRFPNGIPAEVPDPFVGPSRERLWGLFYATRAGFRQRTLKRKEP
jgi:hypothetical protein